MSFCIDEKKSKKDKKDKKDKSEKVAEDAIVSTNGHDGDMIQPEKSAPKIDTSRYARAIYSYLSLIEIILLPYFVHCSAPIH